MPSLKVVAKELRIDPYEMADEINLLMDLQTFHPISCKKLYSRNMYQLYLNASRASECITHEQFDEVLNEAKKMRKSFYSFVQLVPEDNKQYRKQIKKFISETPFQPLSKLHKVDYLKHSFTKVMQSYLYIMETRLKLEDIFLDNNVF